MVSVSPRALIALTHMLGVRLLPRAAQGCSEKTQCLSCATLDQLQLRTDRNLPQRLGSELGFKAAFSVSSAMSIFDHVTALNHCGSSLRALVRS